MVSINVNGRKVDVPEGTTLLQAAEGLGLRIPTLCHHPAVADSGNCRICLVEEEGTGKLVTACDTQVEDGMAVRLDTSKVLDARRAILKLIFSGHPLHCEVCESNNSCELKKLAVETGISGIELPFIQGFRPIVDANPFYLRDLSKCISCGLCVRACQQVQGVGTYEFQGAGRDVRPATSMDASVDESVCEYCGLCASLCPVGALIPKPPMHQGVEEESIITTCPYCGVGCLMELLVRDNKIIGVRAGVPGSVNAYSLCVKGRFGLDFVDHPDRLTKPLIRREGELVETTWEEALDEVASRLKAIKQESEPDAMAFLSSAKATNEENYLLQKFARAVIGTNNVDHCARLCHAPTVAGLAAAFGSGAMTNSISDIEEAEVILLTGTNTTENHPVIGERVKQATLSGRTKLVVVDPRELDLSYYAVISLQQNPGTDVAWINGMAKVILDEELYDKEFIEERTEGFEEWRQSLHEYTPERVEEITGIPARDLARAARLYGKAKRAAIIYAMGITQHITGTDNVSSLANLALLTGNLGREGTGVNPLRGQNNVQGACDLGALPNVFTGYQKVSDEGANKKFSEAWKGELPSEPGLSVVEIMQAAQEGTVRALYIMGENPMVTDPDVGHVKEALESLDLLVVQDIFLTETAALADVVFPGVCFAEKEGTYTNTERRVQRVRKAVDPPGEAKQDLEIIAELSKRLGYTMPATTAEEIMEEIASLTPSYGGISYRRLKEEGLQWPCPDAEHPGTPVLHVGSFPRGKGKFTPVEYIPPDELPDDEYPYILSTGRLLYHWHSGSMTRRSHSLAEKVDRGWVGVNPKDARSLKLKEGDPVRVTSRRGSLVSHAHISPEFQPGLVFATFHFSEETANILTNPALDPKSKIPDLKVCAVKLEKVKGGEGVEAAATA
jgi:formate dehydrogenase alpha subunit